MVEDLLLQETRAGFGDGMLELGHTNPRVVALTADLTGSLKLGAFAKEFPDRFIQCGIAEANMMGTAAGLSISGWIPYTSTFANFSTGRVYDQIRQSIAYSGKNVKICASHAGITLGEDGATHQILEDIGLMKMLPEMTVVVPCDYNQTKAATKQIALHEGPVYLRFGRPKWPTFTIEKEFHIGKVQVLQSGEDITLFACGHMVWTSMQAATLLEKKGISAEVINIHTVKPLDTRAILESVRKTKCCVVAEEHNVVGGLGESIASVLGQYYPAPLEIVGVKDSFGESGKPEELLEKYGLTEAVILEMAKKALSRRT